MNYEHLKIFYLVSKYKNLTRTAEELYTSQPAISRVISNLESELGTKLFYRTKTGVELTKEGLNLYDKIKEQLSSLERFEDDLKKYNDIKQTEIKIGTTATALRCYVLDLLEKYKNQQSDIHFHITTGSTQNMLDDLKAGIIDVAFVTTPFENQKNFEIKEIFEVETILIAGEKFHQELDGEKSLKEISNYPFVLLSKTMKFREYLDDFLADNNISIIPQFEADSSDLILPLVEHNYGLAFIPTSMAIDSIKEGLTFKVNIKEKLPLRKIAAITNKLNNQNKHIIELLKLCGK